MKTQVTKPKQAASASQLDKWQIAVQRMMGSMADEDYPTVATGLYRLLRSMRNAERR